MGQNHQRLNRRRWAATRRAVFERDGWRCVRCGKPGRLECDHVVALEDGGAAYDLDNLRTLCRDCHIQRTPMTEGRRAWIDFLGELTRD